MERVDHCRVWVQPQSRAKAQIRLHKRRGCPRKRLHHQCQQATLLSAPDEGHISLLSYPVSLGQVQLLASSITSMAHIDASFLPADDFVVGEAITDHASNESQASREHSCYASAEWTERHGWPGSHQRYTTSFSLGTESAKGPPSQHQSGVDDAAFTQPSLQKLTVKELKTMCKERSLPQNKLKAGLIQSLLEWQVSR